jgi:hypothetical protein
MRHFRRGAPVLAVAALLAAASPSFAAGEGFWSCSGGAWHTVGRPAYPAPLKRCGSQLAIPETEAQCRDIGGRWGPAGIFPRPICRVQTRDGGRTCGDNDECEGMCLADLTDQERGKLKGKRAALSRLGRCAPYHPVFGCLAMVEKGQVRGVVCRD